jgi:hypothetical protein
MDKNEEIKTLRENITRLRVRLNELDGDNNVEPVTEVCGHDFILDHLKKFGTQYHQSGRCVLAGYNNENWYTTTIEPSKINSLLENSLPIKEFLSIFCNENVWDALVLAFNENVSQINQEIYKILEINQLICGNKLTVKGFICYAVLGHLVFNMTKKLVPEKAIPIFYIAHKITGIEYGEHLPYSINEFIDMIKKHEQYNELVDKGITDYDIGEYIRQINIES